MLRARTGTPAHLRRYNRWAFMSGSDDSQWWQACSMLHLLSVTAALLVCALIATQFAAFTSFHGNQLDVTPSRRLLPFDR
jgi:hypothetical protein